MPHRNLWLPILALAVVLAFAFLLVRLLLLRYERGDVYPAYSSLRSDPLGTRAFYEALETTGRYRLSRGYNSVSRELETNPNAVIYLGLRWDQIDTFTKDEIAALDAYVKSGGRVVITLAPEAPAGDSDNHRTSGEHRKKDTVPEKVSADASGEDDSQTQEEKYEREQQREEQVAEDKHNGHKDDAPPEYQPSLAALWGFGWALNVASKNEKTIRAAAGSAINGDEDAKPDVLAWSTLYGSVEPNAPWKSALYFVRLEPEWKTLFYAKRKPVMIRRRWGQGDILIATDSYFVSNEALRNDCRPMLLNYLAGWPGSLLFDETHLGTERQDGIMNLAEKFRLEGFLLGLFGVVLLLLWRNSFPLVPPRETDNHTPLGGAISGKDSRRGLVNLIRRNIPLREILPVCLKEWKRDVVPLRKPLPSQLTEMESIVSVAESHEIVEAYHHLRELNLPGKKKTSYATKS